MDVGIGLIKDGIEVEVEELGKRVMQG